MNWPFLKKNPGNNSYTVLEHCFDMKFLDDILMKIILQNEIQPNVGSLGKAKCAFIQKKTNSS